MSFRGLAALISAGAAAAVAAGCAQTPAPGQAADSGRQCFIPTQVTTFRVVDDDTVNVFVGANDVYSLDLTGGCPDIDWSLNLQLQSTSGGSWVCGGGDAVLLVPSSTGTQRCMVTNIQKLSPEAAQAARGRGS